MWNYVTLFENAIKDIVGAPYGIATDSCTHAIFISLLWEKEHGLSEVDLPTRTYISVPQTCRHLDLKINWKNKTWNGSIILRVVRQLILPVIFQKIHTFQI